MWLLALAISWNAARCRVGGLPASLPAMSKPTTPESRWRSASSAISLELAAWRMAVASVPMVIGRPALPSRNPSSTDSTTSSRVRPPSMCSSGAKRTSA